MVQFIQSLSVVYGKQPIDVPPNAVPELHGGNNDINFQFGGDYVWLTPNFAGTPGDAATSFVIFISKDPISGYEDLAKGAGGDYRYQKQLADPQDPTKVSLVRLLRSDTAITSPPEGYSGISEDINKGRGKTYLYLIWQETQA